MPKIYSPEKRQEIKQKILQTGLELMKLGGLKKMSIEEITRRVGISQGAFYLFFESKELLVYALAKTYQERLNKELSVFLESHGAINREDVYRLYHNMLLKDEDNIYRYLKREDLTQLLRKLPEENRLNLTDSITQLEKNLSFVTGKKEHYNSAAVINWIQIMYLILENKDILIEAEVERNIEKTIENLLDEIF